jgi:hypothetical protein
VVLVGGKALKDNRELIDGRWDKNDTKDSADVADLISQGKCQFYEHPDGNLVAVRSLAFPSFKGLHPCIKKTQYNRQSEANTAFYIFGERARGRALRHKTAGGTIPGLSSELKNLNKE